ncbi:MAG: HAMP domain-containing histidine kinase [Blautia sp.]|nr:HAMP domain-containing histidine kinase [Blautia sp.]
MKAKLKRSVGTALIIIGGIILCFMIREFFDTMLDGYLLDWLDRKFVYYGGKYNAASIRWERVKEYLFRGLLAFILLAAVAGRVILLVYAARREKQVIHEAGKMIGAYMHHDREVTEVFPREYAEISAQMAEIKSEMQHHEQVLKQEAARKNDLITYLAHDLKTPLTSVVGYLSLLEEAPDMPEEQKAKYIHITLDKALRLEKLINEFFEITRYNLQQIILEKENIDLTFMLMQMADEFYPILREHGNAVDLKVADNLTVYGDSEKLARVFNNILKNAIAYSDAGTEISILAEENDKSVMISFCNYGKTIPAQRLDAIFEKFFRLDDARATNTGGAGLGLAIAKEIVTLHGGTIAADSRDRVTTFVVRLPR